VFDSVKLMCSKDVVINHLMGIWSHQMQYSPN